MFNRFWHDIWTLMFVLLIIIGVIAGQGLVIGLGAMGLLVGGVSWLWNRLALEDVQYERVVEQTRIFLGEQTRLTISVINRKPLPIARLDIEDDFPEEIEFTDSSSSGQLQPQYNHPAPPHISRLVRTDQVGVHDPMRNARILQDWPGQDGERRPVRVLLLPEVRA